MPRKKNTDASSVAQIIDKFSTGLRDDLSKLYQMGFEAGAVSERKRIASVFQGDAVSKTSVSPKSSEGSRSSPFGELRSNPVKAAVSSKPKKLRKNPWASYTPEQKAERLKNLAAAREKARASKEPAITNAMRGEGDSTPTATSEALASS